MKTRARRGTENVAAICDLGEESFIEMAEYHGGGGGSAVDDTLGGACVTDRAARRALHRPRKSRNAFFQTVVFGALLQPPLIRRCCDNCRQ